MIDRVCQSERYDSLYMGCEADGPVWDVVYRNADGQELDRHPACFRHGLVEQDRHHASAGIASCMLEKAGP